MARVTDKDLKETAEAISRMTGQKHFIYFAYGRKRLAKMSGGSGGWTEVSPSLSSGELMEWMYAYIKGMEDGTYLCNRRKRR